MNQQDHYRILEVEPSATLPEIKRAYRRLAQQYHPDKTLQDPYAASQFAAIKEAYEVLTNPVKKEKYLQQRWFDQTMGREKSRAIITPHSVLKEVMELERQVSLSDRYRMNKVGLREYLEKILDGETIASLNAFREPEINKEILAFAMKVGNLLPYRDQLALSEKWSLLHNEPSTQEKIRVQLKQAWQHSLWETYQPLLVFILVILICLLIFTLSS